MRRIGMLFVALALLGGCDEQPIQVGPRPQPSASGPGPAGPAQAIEGADAGVDAGPARPQYRDEDFVEADSNRDPFRNYAASFQVRVTQEATTTRDVVMSTTSLDEMRLIGIVSGVADPRAMILDRDGRGYTVRRGVYIGRAEIVQAGGIEDLPVTLNWRVDRIRANEVVLTRDDPTAPNRPPLTRVLPLRDQAEELELSSPAH